MAPLSAACQVCGPRADVAASALLKCSRCSVVYYCSRDHQSADFEAHKATCKQIKKLRTTMVKEEFAVRNATPDAMTPANAFVTHVGKFWSTLNARPFMKAKLELIRALSVIPSRLAIESALAEALDSQRLCRADNLGIRYLIPTLMLLLGQYQEAYDFLKWWMTDALHPNYDYDDMSAPYLSVHNADLTEDMPQALKQDREVFFTNTIAYFKRALVQAVDNAMNDRSDRVNLPALDLIFRNGRAPGLADLKKLHTKLTRHMHQAFCLAHAQNPYFCQGVLDPTPIVNLSTPEIYEPGDKHHVKLWVQQAAMLWRDDLEFIRGHHF